MLPFSPEASKALIDGLYDAIGQKRSRAGVSAGDDTLRAAAPVFTNAWLLDTLPKALGGALPDLRNRDGEEVVFHEVRFPLAKGVTQKDIAARLGSVRGLEQENAGFWNWLERTRSAPRRSGKEPKALAWDVTLEGGIPVLGNVELKGRFLTLLVNSASRATRGTEMLTQALGELVRSPLTAIQTLEQAMEARPDDPQTPSLKLPLEVETTIVHEMLDRQYRSILDEPVGALGNKSPRSAARTKAGREKVAEWLKYLEYRSAGSPDPADPMATYDFGWLWRELKVEDLRR